MADLSQIELENLKNIIDSAETSYKKLNMYESNCTDPQIKQYFKKFAQEELNTKQKLIIFLNN